MPEALSWTLPSGTPVQIAFTRNSAILNIRETKNLFFTGKIGISKNANKNGNTRRVKKSRTSKRNENPCSCGFIGEAFESLYKNDDSVFKSGIIGNAKCKLINQRRFVDFAVNWMNQNRS